MVPDVVEEGGAVAGGIVGPPFSLVPPLLSGALFG